MMRFAAALSLAATLALPALADGHLTPAPDGAEVYFVGIADGDTVSSPLIVRFGLSGMGVAPAGVEQENTGHHHLLIDRPALGEGEYGAEELELGIPADDHHVHFGGGQTEVSIELAPGSHTLQLVLGDHGHVPHDPPIASDVITVTVE
ncbi:MAG: DUF4399 domain-containing protein [Mangrovicoccus sp.]|nr:DUF4399 domain-containing protein [Mangrovicoccus sp.]